MTGLQVLRDLGYRCQFSDDNERITTVLNSPNSLLHDKVVWQRTSEGFYGAEHDAIVKQGHTHLAMEGTVLANARIVTEQQRLRATAARNWHIRLNHPGPDAMKQQLQSPSLTNCDITTADLALADELFGECEGCAGGKPHPRRGQYSTVESLNVVDPGQMWHCDIVFVHGKPYLLCVCAVSERLRGVDCVG